MRRIQGTQGTLPWPCVVPCFHHLSREEGVETDALGYGYPMIPSPQELCSLPDMFCPVTSAPQTLAPSQGAVLKGWAWKTEDWGKILEIGASGPAPHPHPSSCSWRNVLPKTQIWSSHSLFKIPPKTSHCPWDNNSLLGWFTGPWDLAQPPIQPHSSPLAWPPASPLRWVPAAVSLFCSLRGALRLSAPQGTRHGFPKCILLCPLPSFLCPGDVCPATKSQPKGCSWGDSPALPPAPGYRLCFVLPEHSLLPRQGTYQTVSLLVCPFLSRPAVLNGVWFFPLPCPMRDRCQKTSLVVMTGEFLLASSGQRPEILLNIPQCTGLPAP